MISDNDLLLYYYRDGLDADERARIATAIGEQPELAARLHRLVARLDVATAAPEVPVPEQVQQRWRAALASASAGEAASKGSTMPAFSDNGLWRLAAAACVLAVVIVGVRLTLIRAPDALNGQVASSAQPAATASLDPQAYERGLRWHLTSTEQQIGDLDNASREERQQLIQAIIEQNRLYAIAAERADEPDLARVLRAFTPLLESLAVDRGDRSAGEAAQLSFELNVMQARLNAAAAQRSSADTVAL